MSRSHIISEVDEDALGLIRPPSEWTAEEVTRATALARGARPSRRAAVVATMRDEGVSILQWVAHYRVLGFDGIFIYSHDNRDVSPALLGSLAAAGVITYIEFRTAAGVSPQLKAYGHSLRALPELRDYEWVLYADADEFLTLAPRYEGDIGKFLDHVHEEYRDTLPSAILFHWKGYVSDFVYEREAGLLLERFQYSGEDRHFKSLVRLSEVGTMNPVHFPELLGEGFFVDSALQPVEGNAEVDATWRYLTQGTPTYEGGQIRHFWAKSFQEFAIKKRRGDTLALASGHFKLDVRLFFEWNGRSTPERFEPPDEDLIRRTHQEMRRLRSLPGVEALDRRLSDSFLDLLEPMGGDEELRPLYERLARDALRAPSQRRRWWAGTAVVLVVLAILLVLLGLGAAGAPEP